MSIRECLYELPFGLPVSVLTLTSSSPTVFFTYLTSLHASDSYCMKLNLQQSSLHFMIELDAKCIVMQVIRSNITYASVVCYVQLWRVGRWDRKLEITPWPCALHMM